MKALPAMIVCAVLAACTDPIAVDGVNGTLARKLERGMTERQVDKLSGGRVPDRIILTLCGAKTPKPFDCKVYVYEGSMQTNGFDQKLSIIFEKSDGTWLVGQWL
jgi:hypothetical protein